MSTTFTVTRDQVITMALRKLGVIELGDTPDSTTIQACALTLNLFIKQMATEGLKLWKVNELTLPLVNGQVKYVIGPPTYGAVDLNTDKPLKLIQAWIRNTTVTPNTDTMVTVFSQQEYNMLGSKQSSGVVNSIYMENRSTTANLYVYVAPNATTATNYQLHIVVQQPIGDILRAQDILDFPVEWMNTLVWNLADQLAIEYSVPQNHRQEIIARAKQYREELGAWDVEASSTFFQPDYRMYVPNTGNQV